MTEFYSVFDRKKSDYYLLPLCLEQMMLLVFPPKNPRDCTQLTAIIA